MLIYYVHSDVALVHVSPCCGAMPSGKHVVELGSVYIYPAQNTIQWSHREKGLRNKYFVEETIIDVSLQFHYIHELVLQGGTLSSTCDVLLLFFRAESSEVFHVSLHQETDTGCLVVEYMIDIGFLWWSSEGTVNYFSDGVEVWHGK